MATSPTLSIRSREIIGTDAFSRRREVFGQHDTVFLPSPPVSPILDDRGKSAPGFRRTPAYSSMRESRRDDIGYELGFRERKMSDNFNVNQSEEVDYRHSMTERTRRLSKLRREFLTSNLHEPSSADPFTRAGTRASMPLKSPGGTYKVGSGTIYKFPFAEPFSTPPPTRKVFVDLGPADGEAKENKDPESEDREEVDSPNKHQSLPNNPATPVDHHQLFNELLKRYSPQQKPIDWSLPPTKPRVIAALPKSSSTDVYDDQVESVEDKLEIVEDKLETVEDKLEITEQKLEIVEQNNEINVAEDNGTEENDISKEPEESKRLSNDKVEENGTLKESSDELDEKNDTVPELIQISRQNSHEAPIKRTVVKDETIPALLDKISQEGDTVEKSEKKKVKRKRSFLDKLLNRNKK